MVKQLGKKELPVLNEAYQKVLQWFFSYPNTEIGLNDISEALEIAKTTAKIIVNKLQQEGFLSVNTVGRALRIKCNPIHPFNTVRKIGFNLTTIYESGIINEIHKIIPNSKAVVLFGSYRKGDDTEKSDIDIAVEITSNEEPKIIPLGVLQQLGYRKNVPVNLYIFSRNKVDLNLFANIANGILLEGFLEARP
jgi:predicted nucleotidyltransferase